MTICKKRLAPLALALLLAFGLIVGAAPVSADAANEHVTEFLDVIGPMASADMQQERHPRLADDCRRCGKNIRSKPVGGECE